MSRHNLINFMKRRPDFAPAVSLYALSLSIYLATLCPTFYWGDSGELAAAAYTLGIAHPTGYPLWCMLAKLWTLVFPFGTIVWRLNVFSAVCGAFAPVALYGCARTIGLSRPLAVSTAGLFAFGFTFWQQCLFTETYSLTAAYTCLLLFLAVRWRARGCTPVDLRQLALAYGFAMTNHQTNTLLLPGFLAFVFLAQPALLRLRDPGIRRQWAATAAVWLAPLAIYVYLPIRSAAHPGVDWGHPSTWHAFVYHISGGLFHHEMFWDRLSQVWMRVVTFGRDLRVEFPWAVWIAALAGLALLWLRGGDRALAVLFTWIVLADVAYTANYDIYNGYIYLIPTYAVVSLLAGYAAHRALVHLSQRGLGRPATAAIATAICLTAFAIQIHGHWNVGLRGNTVCYDYDRNILLSAPPNAVLIDNNDVSGYPGLTYLQEVEGMRRDVVVVNRGLLAWIYMPDTKRWDNIWEWEKICRQYPRARELFGKSPMTPRQAVDEEPLKRLINDAVRSGRPVVIDALQQSNPVWASDGSKMPLSDYLQQRYTVAQVGLLNRVYPSGPLPSIAEIYAESQRVWGLYRQPADYAAIRRRDHFLMSIAIDYAWANLGRARIARKEGDYRTAATAYANVLALYPCTEAVDGLRFVSALAKKPTSPSRRDDRHDIRARSRQASSWSVPPAKSLAPSRIAKPMGASPA